MTHGRPDHCADLNPLLRARVLPETGTPLPVWALPGALDKVLALDGKPLLAGSFELHDLGTATAIGPFAVRAMPLTHFVPNLGGRLTAGGTTLAYTGDAAPDGTVLDLARDVDVLLAASPSPARSTSPSRALTI